MTQRRLLPVLLPCLWVAACASDPSLQPDPDIEKAALERRSAIEQLEEKQNDFQAVLLNLDKTMDKYVESVVQGGLEQADHRSQSIEKFLRETVQEHFDQLVLTADAFDQPDNRAIAVAALGFSRRPEVLDTLLTAARDPNPVIVNNAIFGLGILRDERTPPLVVAAVVEDTVLPTKVRIGAAWTLFRVQEVIHNPDVVHPVWLRLLGAPEGTVDSWILVQALRGLSRSRDPQHAKVVEPLTKHPTALVRTAAVTCLGYLGNRDSHVVLLERISPAETNPNVRLAARKALQALAGNVDRGYDVKQWRRVFEVQPDGQG
jgi:HEAT repeat protein